MRRRLFKLLALILVAATLAAPPVVAADEQIGAFLIVDGVDDAIALVGEITANSPLDFRRALQKRPNATMMVTASPGGLVPSALIIAQDLYARGLGTYIPTGAGCYSACAYVFLAGQPRQADGELGVHQMESATQSNAGTQLSVSDMVDTLLEFDTPREVLSRMLRTPNNEMYVFSPQELEQLGINRTQQAAVPPVTPKPPSTSTPTTTPPRGPAAGAGGPETGLGRLAIYEGMDFYGADISSGRALNLVECTRACMGDKSCRAFTFNANPKLTSGPNCFLKSGVDRLEGYEQAISGLLLEGSYEPAPSFTFGVIDPTRDVDTSLRLSGDTLRTISGSGSLGECRQTCAADDLCVAFTYRTSDRQCQLKEEVGRRSDVRGYTSGVKRTITFEATDVIALDE